MPFTNPGLAYAASTFCGGKVRNFNSNMGWGAGSPSQLTVQLVDDPAYGAVFSPPAIGSPVYFSAGGFSFGGLFQKYETRRDVQGNPLYSAVVVDPREILAGAQLVIGAYSGPVNSVANVFNCYGYWESKGYGSSGANETGMPWRLVEQAVTTLCRLPAAGVYGGPLSFRGYDYSVDLSDLPSPSIHYRVGGVSVSLLEAISQVCEDGGRDFFVELVGLTIRVRTVSRATQPPLGTISAVAEAAGNSGTVPRVSSGLECRNELTSAVLVGGDVSQLWQTGSVYQFWGYDFDGNPVLGRDVEKKLRDADGNIIATVITEEMYLNAAPVADFLGELSYYCTTIEMRMAQGGYETWAMFMNTHRKPTCEKIQGIPCPFLNNGGVAGMAVAARPNIINDDPLNAQLAHIGQQQDRSMKLYELVRGYADEYMGRKFVVSLPFVETKVDDETGKATTSWEVVDAAYMEEGAAPLGISELNEDLFKTQDGRFRAFVTFGTLETADLSKVSPQGAVIENNLLYQQCSVDPEIISVNNSPHVVLSVQGPVVDREAEVVGDLKLFSWLLQGKEDDCKRFAQRVAIPIKIAPKVRIPTAVAVPLKSNSLTYGPWFAFGAPGKVRVEHDPSLTPWGYGGFEVMSLAAQSRVNGAVTNQQVAETGSIEMVGLPTVSLGDVLHASGPNVTSVDVQYGVDGVATTYRFGTFTQTFGTLGKGNIERIKRMALAGAEVRRAARLAFKEALAKLQIRQAAARAKKWREDTAKALKKETPQDVLHVYCDTSSAYPRTNPGVTTYEEALAIVKMDGSGDAAHDFRRSAFMSLSGLFRPFSTNGNGSGMPAYAMPTYSGNHVPTRLTLDPWKAKNDIEAYSYGTTYSGSNAYFRGIPGTASGARVFGLRSPLVLVGWGYDTDCNPVPGSGAGYPWHEDYLVNQSKWKAGPTDLLWDNRRGVWTCHGTLKGVTSTPIPANGSGNVTVSANGTTYPLENVQNYFSSAVATAKKVILNYVPTDNRWYVVAADC